MSSANRWRRRVSLGALAIGAVLFAVTLTRVDFVGVFAMGRRFGVAVAYALAVSAAVDLTRTWAWSWCFARPRSVPYLKLLRVRIAADAISNLTVSGVAGDPLKVVLLVDRVPGREATAAVALERISNIVGTALVIGIAAGIALATLPLSPAWFRTFRAFAIGAGLLAAAIALIVIRRDSYLLAALRAADRAAGTHVTSGRMGRFVGEIGRELGMLLRGDGRRLVVLTVTTLIVYAFMSAEVWLVLHAVGVKVSWAGAIAIETFARVASFAASPIPANLGALEASCVAAATAVGVAAGGAPLALARRLRGLFWTGVGLAIYPRHSSHSAPAILPQPPAPS